MGFPKSYATTILQGVFGAGNEIALLLGADPVTNEVVGTNTNGYVRYTIKSGDFDFDEGAATTAKNILLFLATEYIGTITHFAVWGNGTCKYVGELNEAKPVGKDTVPVFKIYNETDKEGVKVTLDVVTTASASVNDAS